MASIWRTFYHLGHQRSFSVIRTWAKSVLSRALTLLQVLCSPLLASTIPSADIVLHLYTAAATATLVCRRPPHFWHPQARAQCALSPHSESTTVGMQYSVSFCRSETDHWQ
ncbi:hypothetical protein BDR03DRAFT_418162 [Suillus americanus]|nr:hypothetical protein BDR03DRAFT_418162 [Suillus americanus]